MRIDEIVYENVILFCESSIDVVLPSYETVIFDTIIGQMMTKRIANSPKLASSFFLPVDAPRLIDLLIKKNDRPSSFSPSINSAVLSFRSVGLFAEGNF